MAGNGCCRAVLPLLLAELSSLLVLFSFRSSKGRPCGDKEECSFLMTDPFAAGGNR